MTEAIAFEPNEDNFVSLSDFFATEIRAAARLFGFTLSKGHALEIVSAAYGYKSYAAMRTNGLLLSDRYPHSDVSVDIEQARQRAISIDSSIAQNFEPIAERLENLHHEASDPLIALAVRLARNICWLTEWDPRFNEFNTRTLLAPDDHRACHELAARDDFVDGVWRRIFAPTIAAFGVTMKPLKQDGGYHAIIAEPVLNVAAFLAPDRVLDIVERYRVVLRT